MSDMSNGQKNYTSPGSVTTRSRSALSKSNGIDEDDLFDPDFPLPFAAAAAYKSAYMSPDTGHAAAFGPPPAHMLVSPARSNHSRGKRDSTTSTAAETQADLFLELQCGQAMLEAQEFEILPWDTVEDLKNVPALHSAGQASY
jgi:hypothetical protein